MTEDEAKTRAVKVCRAIAADMAADAKRFDGQPFNGRTVAEYFGSQGAAIAALADILSHVLELDELSPAGKP